MKKKLLCIVAVMLVWALSACSANKTEENTESAEVITSAVDVLNRVWESYSEDEKFPAAGGDYDHSVMDEPGTFDISNKEMLEMMLYVPQDEADVIDDAALLMHMMNVNTFTAGSFCLNEEADRDAFAAMMEAAIMDVQWMCGFPDELLIVSVGKNCVVTAFGNEELIQNFEDKLLAAYEGAAVLYEEMITE
jgi:hypothetical protein